MSFISVEPQSRVLLYGHSNSLLAQFDTQLQIIANRYLAFFQERRHIEAIYIDSLRNLYRKTMTVDASYDPRVEPTTTRTAWDKITNNLEKETNTQQAFVDILDNDVIKPLRSLKESNDGIRRNIERDLKSSAARYADHAENTISKLQQAYLKKYSPQYAPSTDVVLNKRFGNKVTSVFRRSQPLEPAKSEDVSDDDCRQAVGQLSDFRWIRAEHLEDGYDFLDQLVHTPTVKDVLVKYMDGMITACAQYANLATSTRAEVEKSLGGRDTSDLTASFRRALSHSIPPPALYRNYRLGPGSRLIFGVPLVQLETDPDNVPKVLRMCIEEAEKKYLNTRGIYSANLSRPVVVQMRQRLESEKPFSFSPAEGFHHVSTFLKNYLRELPEPLFMLSLQNYRSYTQIRTSYKLNDLSFFRSKIRELHPVQRTSLGALLRHLLRVASHSNANGTTVTALATNFSHFIFRGDAVGVAVKALVLEDLIQNAHTLFDERPSSSPPAEARAMDAPTQHGPALVDGFPTSSQSSFSSLPSDPTAESRLAPTPTSGPSRLQGFPSSKTLTEGVDATTQEQVIAEARGTEAVETLANSTPPEVVSDPSTSVAEWRLRQSALPPQPEAVTIPQSPPASMLSSLSNFPLSSATSLQTGMGQFPL